MEDLLIEILLKFGYPVILQGSLAPKDAYPEHFFTFWNDDSSDESNYDNQTQSILYEYSVNFYSIDAEKVYSVLRQAVTELKRHNFIVSGDGYSVPTDEPSHDGRGITVYYLKNGGMY